MNQNDSRTRTLSHLASDGSLSMVDVGDKPVTRREASATGVVHMSEETMRLVVEAALPKGDVLAAAKIAGILAAKQAPFLIPLTHPLTLSYIDVVFDVRREESRIVVTSTVRCEGRTGVEIEAMVACSIACLTIYDMCKSAERGMRISDIQLERKSGGKSGAYRRS